MHCDFYDGGVKAVTLPTSCIPCVCVYVRLSAKGMEEGMIGDDIIS